MSELENLLGGLIGGRGGAGGLGGLLGGIGAGPAFGSRGGAPMLLALMPLLTGMLAGGGLQRLIAGFQSQGLGGHADSWIGKGTNQEVSGEQVRQVLGDDKLAEIAQKLGVSHEEAAQAVAQVLPHVVDHVTPDGHVPEQQHVDSSLDQLEQSAAKATST